MSLFRRLQIKLRNKWHDSEFKSGFLNFIFWLTIATIFITPYIVGIFDNLSEGEIELKYVSLIFLLMSIIPIISVVLGVKYKKIGYQCKKNIIGGIIILALMLMYSFAGFIGQKTYDIYTDKDYSYITNLEKIVNIDLPDEGKIKTYRAPVFGNMTEISFSDVVFTNKQEIMTFDEAVKNSDLWTNKATSYLKMITTATVWSSSDWSQEYYYLVYNVDLKTYNEVPKDSGKYHSYFIRYNMNAKELFINEYYLDFISE